MCLLCLLPPLESIYFETLSPRRKGIEIVQNRTLSQSPCGNGVEKYLVGICFIRGRHFGEAIKFKN